MKYRIDIEVLGWVTVEVEADSDDTACDLAIDKFDQLYLNRPIADLQYKRLMTNILDRDGNDR